VTPAMVRIVYQDTDGAQREVNVEPGVSLMEAAVKNRISAIEGECGGAMACATCHVYIPEQWQALTGVASAGEIGMLDCAEAVDARSRLGCQIAVTPAMDGMVVLTPRTQR